MTATIIRSMEPRSLYRYRSLQDLPEDGRLGRLNRELRALEGNYLYCSGFRALNDPMEGIFSLSTRSRLEIAYQLLRSQKRGIGICSFSETKNNEIMWAHYASQFSGICISYDFSRLRKRLSDSISFVRMFYNEKAPRLRSATGTIDEAKMILSSKSYRWLYEREWRMFADKGKVAYEESHCVRAVYLGFRMSRQTEEIIAERLGKLNIKTQRMKIRKYSITFERGSQSSSEE